jgi:hypothetical protein
MIGFGFFPFGFLLPLIFIVIITRVASAFFRSSSHRYRFPEDDSDYRRALERQPFEVPGRVVPQENQEAMLFKLAYRLKGRLTVSDIVVETGMGVAESERLIQSPTSFPR